MLLANEEADQQRGSPSPQKISVRKPSSSAQKLQSAKPQPQMNLLKQNINLKKQGQRIINKKMLTSALQVKKAEVSQNVRRSPIKPSSLESQKRVVSKQHHNHQSSPNINKDIAVVNQQEYSDSIMSPDNQNRKLKSAYDGSR